MNPNNLPQLADSLSEILNTPVSPEILNHISEKQFAHLKRMIENIVNPNRGAFYYKSEEESRKVIYSILDYGKSKLPKKERSEKVNLLLTNKKLI